MFGMEPYVQLQEYSTKFFIQLNHKKKISLCYADMRSWTEICKSKKNRVEWSANSIQQDQHGQLRTMSDPV